MNEYIGTLFQTRTQAHIFHLQTNSFAAHKALQEYYEGIVGLIDQVAEAYQGKYGIVTGYKMNLVTGDLVDHGQVVLYFEQVQRFLELKRPSLPKDTFLQNLFDTVDELVSSTVYKLKFLS